MDLKDRLWHSSCGKYTVALDVKCLEKLADLACRAWPCETGATLVGSYSDDGFTARIDEAGPMPPDSMGKKMSFVRGVIGLRKFFNRIFSDSDGKRHYIGEWHSHPNGVASPSCTDDITSYAICENEKTRCPEMILLLIATDKKTVTGLGIFVYSRCRGRIELHEE